MYTLNCLTQEDYWQTDQRIRQDKPCTWWNSEGKVDNEENNDNNDNNENQENDNQSMMMRPMKMRMKKILTYYIFCTIFLCFWMTGNANGDNQEEHLRGSGSPPTAGLQAH